MIIDGPTTTRDDGSTVCIGYGVDGNDNVTRLFALPKGSDWQAPEATESVEFVESMEQLPSVDSQYLDE